MNDTLNLDDVVIDGHRRGWSFLPLEGKKPRDKGWTTAAREGLEQALAWAELGNVGVRTGAASGGLVVVDVDAAKGGTLDGLPALPVTVVVETGGGGFHYYFRNTSKEEVGNRAGKIAAHVDVRGEGGQVVAAGCMHPETGALYQYAPGRAPWEVDVAELPGWLRRRINPIAPPPMTPAADSPAPAEPGSPPRPPSNRKSPSGVDRYAASAFRSELKKVAGAGEGTRNDTLNRAAFALGQFVGANRLQRGDVEAALLASTTLPEGEARATIRSGLEAGIAQPRQPEEVKVKRPKGAPAGEARPGSPPVEPGSAFTPPRPPSSAGFDSVAAAFGGPTAAAPPPNGPPPPSAFPAPPGGATASPMAADASRLLTDLGNAERLVKRHGVNLRYVYGLNRWHAWDGRRWAADDSGRIMELCKETALSVFNEAAAATTEGEQRALSAHALKTQSRDRLAAMEFLARSRLAVPNDRLDLDPWSLNCTNGTVDLRDGTLRPHNRDDLITRMCSVPYEPAAVAPRWLRLFDEVLPDREVQVFVQRWCGHGCTGDVREQYLPIWWGDGNNGKSVILDTVGEILGGYATKAPPELLTAQAGGDHPTDIADLMGRRFVVASETEQYARLRVQLMKRLTGDASLKGRFMRQDFFEFNRTHKLVLATNNKPEIAETTGAVWRRIRLVHFGVVIPDHKIDKSLFGKLRAEHPGILAWLVRGAVDWLREGLTEPAAVMAATRSYRDKSDAFGEFVEQCLERGPDYSVGSDELRRAYESFCKTTGDDVLAGRAFGDKLRSIGGTPDKTPAKRIWVGFRLR